MPSNEEYDPNIAQDHTGMVFRAVGRALDSGWRDLFRGNPVAHGCPGCDRTDRFRILVDDDPKSGMIMIGCECGKWTKPFELRMPQMDDVKAKRLGLYIPKMVLTEEFELEGN